MFFISIIIYRYVYYKIGYVSRDQLNPPTSPERRACETTLQAPKQAASQPASQPASKARQQGSQAARQSSPPGTQAAGIQDLGARMLRSYHLIILSSSIGDLLRRNSMPQPATGRQHSGPPPSSWAHFWLQNHNKNDAETKGLEGRFKGRKRVARHPIRSCLCSPNAFSHFLKKFKISSKMYSLWVSISLSLEPFSRLSSSSGSRAPRPRPKVGTR